MLQDNDRAHPGGDFHWNFSIDAGHPSLPGHFPDHPIVPGALLLQRILERLQDQFAPLQLRSLQRARFSSPVLPGDVLALGVECKTGSIRFRGINQRTGTPCVEGRVLLDELLDGPAMVDTGENR